MLQFAPQRMARQDAEIAADIGNDGTDGPMADLRGDPLRGGEVGQVWVPAGLRGPRGRYPKGTLNFLVDRQLREYGKSMRSSNRRDGNAQDAARAAETTQEAP